MKTNEIRNEIRSIRQQVNKLLCLAQEYEEREKALKSLKSAEHRDESLEFCCSVKHSDAE